MHLYFTPGARPGGEQNRDDHPHEMRLLLYHAEPEVPHGGHPGPMYKLRGPYGHWFKVVWGILRGTWTLKVCSIIAVGAVFSESVTELL